MSEEVVDQPFEAALENVEEAHKKAVAQLRTNLEKAKSTALKKIGP